MKLLKFPLYLLLLLAAYSSAGFAQITISHPQVTDVTPSSFSVLWHASEASVPRIEVFSSIDDSIEITDQVEVIAFPLQAASSGLGNAYERAQSRLDLRQVAQQKGLNKVQVRGLVPDTFYRFKVYSESATDSGVWPASGVNSVKTENENSLVTDSGILVVALNDPDARGWLVSATVADARHRVSSFAEAGAEPGQAVLNLSNLFGSNGLNWFSSDPTTLTIEVIKGDGELVSETITLDLGDSFEVASLIPAGIGTPFDALISIVAPDQKLYTRGDNVTLGWTDQADGINATISLYIDVDTSGEDGVLIASGIEEDPDGAGDQYDWDVSSVAEGSYYVYAVMSDGTNDVSSYGSAKITIDHTQTDGDVDEMSDLWELHYFDTLTRDGNGDFEGDTVPDWLEHFYLSNPEQTNAPLTQLTLALDRGSHIVGVPGLLVPRVGSQGLLQQLGDKVQSISRFNPDTKQMEVTYWDSGSPAGDDFFLLPGQGYFIQMLEDASVVWTPFDADRSIPLKQGVNVVALTNPSGDAFDLLGALGSDSVWSIRRLNPSTSLYETAAYDSTETVGIPFPLMYGEGYIVTVKQDSSLP